MCRRGWERHSYQWITFTINGAGGARYKTCIWQSKIFNLLNPLFKPQNLYLPLCFQATTTESPEATENNNSGLISFKQWVSESTPHETEAAVHQGQCQAACWASGIWNSRPLFCALYGSMFKPQLFWGLNPKPMIQRKQPSIRSFCTAQHDWE